MTRPCLLAALVLAPAFAATVAVPAIASTPDAPAASADGFSATVLGRYANDGSEVVAVAGDRMYVIDADARLDIVDISDPSQPMRERSVDLSTFGPSINSVAATDGRAAVVLPAAHKTDPGTLLLLNPAGKVLREVQVGANPDMVTFDEAGRRILVANEGEPVSYAPQDDAEGSVSVVDVRRMLARDPGAAATIDFRAFDEGGARHDELPAEVRVFGPGASVSEDLEPEYITVEGDRAWVSLQENNAIAELDLASLEVAAIRALAPVDHSADDAGFDASDRDGAIDIRPRPVFGLPMPDAIASFVVGGETYLVSANEGDSREDWPGYAEEIRVGAGGYVLDPTAFPDAATLKTNAELGRLTVTRASGDDDGDGDYDRIVAFGTRSASIWNASTSERVADTGDLFERTIAELSPADFNTNNDENAFDSRSDNKGPEPEAVAVGTLGDRTLAFVGLERQGGVMVLDVSVPAAPVLVTYLQTRDYAADPESGETDSGVEVLRFVAASDSPTGEPLLISANEVSSTVVIWQLAG
ncbi:MAG: choice-of-anchor I family protein [Microcella sp.]|uniref:choice-of-anchor I family protein n=1 Tax=Microcella sp. TaxID=1913979 RepID=UPI002719973A|nr:choice-of-anchor I family protein [Microcella sp.]MDO8337927.1 choice-of-anchor I family protein [Microcella sp.]